MSDLIEKTLEELQQLGQRRYIAGEVLDAEIIDASIKEIVKLRADISLSVDHNIKLAAKLMNAISERDMAKEKYKGSEETKARYLERIHYLESENRMLEEEIRGLVSKVNSNSQAILDS